MRTLGGNFEYEILRMREFSSQFLDNLPEIECTQSCHNFHALAQSVMMQRTEYWVPNSNTGGCVSVGTLFPNDINY